MTTARRRSEDVQETPLAVTALSEQTLQRFQIQETSDLARLVPNMVISPLSATADQVAVYIRGFGTNSNDPSIDPPIAMYLDGVYLPTMSGTQLDLFGASGIEVDRGPQGTLLGKNAPTGAISITSRRPTNEFEGEVQAGYERFDLFQVKARVNIPIISDVLAMSLAATEAHGGNFVEDAETGRRQFGGQDVQSAKLGLLFTPNDRFEWLLQMSGDNSRDPQAGNRDVSYLGVNGPLQQSTAECLTPIATACTNSGRFVTNAGFLADNKENSQFLSSQIHYRFDPVTLTSVTGYKRYQETDNTDIAGTEFAYINASAPSHYMQASEEIRVASNKNGGADLDGHLDWIAGVYYSYFHYRDDQNLSIFATPVTGWEEGGTHSKAVFGHGIYDITSALNVSIGVRETSDEKTYTYQPYDDPPSLAAPHIGFHNLSSEAGLQYKFTSDRNVYARFAQGFRSGGYSATYVRGDTPAYQPEKVNTVEVGFKGDFLDHHLRINADVFQSNYTDLQETNEQLGPTGGLEQIIQNVAKAKVRGVELESTVVITHDFTVSTNVGYLDPKYENYVTSLYAGAPPTNNDNFAFPYASRWNVRTAPQYALDLPNGLGKVMLSASGTYSTSYNTYEVPFPFTQVSALFLLDASVKYLDPTGKYSVTFYGHNLTDRHYFSYAGRAPGPDSLYMLANDARPITYGIILAVDF